MKLLVLLAALLLANWAVLPGAQFAILVRAGLRRSSALLVSHRTRIVMWSLWVVGATLVVWLGFRLTAEMTGLAGFAYSVAVMYLLLEVRTHHQSFTEVHVCLAAGDLPAARHALTAWTGQDACHAGAAEMARLSIEAALLQAHRQLFGLMFWFFLLPGPAGAVFYWMARELAQARCGDDRRERDSIPLRMFGMIDWLPVRVSALSFSILGNFEDAIYCWRSQSMLWADKASGILLASGAGALGVRLGLPIHSSVGVVDRPELGTGHKADTQQMHRAAKLVWRVLLLWLLLLILFGLAGLMGR